MSIPVDSFSPLQHGFKAEAINRPSTTLWQDAWRRFRKNPLAMGGLAVLTLIILFAIFGPFFSHFDYKTNNLMATNQYPDWIHPFGTDELGRDILTRAMFGARISLLIGFGSVAINLTIGIFYGGISGYIGGWLDNLMQRIIDTIYSIPDLLYVILLMVTFGSGLRNIFIVLGLVNWVPMARIVRGQILALREQEFVLAARTLGASTPRILIKHLLPNSIGQIIIVSALQIPAAIFMESFLSFIGLGVQAPLVSLGSMASDGRMNIPSYPYSLIFPAAMIALLMLAFNFVGDGLRDAFDPKMRK
ncbi:ABC-type dipeptide/oligopeptide/nickel transport system, permease component [Desulfosporosinus orientis DSM 765]|uniref:ABC-type dipeptide/oligopeptide/nickel transport system, permease component n=1 Tax=Desulfosporosinus orientis (strain ATCC 19365 / DSM 765 / NCIMB 8382 / VKM B-1628 / Singapore I) TaxID=768706 RepID=G7W5S5_DESOD|nr:ABC transporter permease [Desulfosporosinus orientis]AET67013.1 ABC-type dipeptide/oligopeptide/nickel transport system, permease component [Desulfosporosinus orientis DSM 765]